MAAGAGWAWLRNDDDVVHLTGVRGPRGPLTAVVDRVPVYEPGDRVRIDAGRARVWHTPTIRASATALQIADACTAVRPHLWNDPRALSLGTAPIDHVAAELAGRGPGLTPAGDDALAGYVATLVILHRPDVAEAQAAAHRAAATTGQPSRSLLLAAIDGEIFAPAAAMLHALVDDPTTIAPSLRRLTALGQTTGRALLTGIVRALTA